jgi:serine/threonine protein phosphatase PrpC
LKLEFAQVSDPGRDPNKQVNEDACGYAETRFGHLCVLCDGMGGHYGGKEASRTAIATIFEVIDQTPSNFTPSQALKAAIEEAGRRVYRLGGPPENRTRPGSTVVAMLLHDKGVDVAHVGDSRAYVIRAQNIYPLTRDHSMVQGMIDAGMLTEEQAIGHPDANKITRALGMKPEVECEVRPEPMELFAGDVLMQSSDGLTDLAIGAEILRATKQALASGPVEHAAKMLVQLANDRGGHDNITVQMVRVVEAGPKASATIPGAPTAGAGGVQPTRTGTPAPAAVVPGQGGWAAPTETVAMTAPDAAPMQPQPMMRAATTPYPPAAQPMATPYPPPAVHYGPGPTADGVGPTMLETPPPSVGPNPAWSSGMYNGPTPPQVPQGQPLAPYRMDAPQQALPLPPPSVRQPYGTSSPPTVPPQAPRGGIVYLIIGLSAFIAVLILVILYLVLR